MASKIYWKFRVIELFIYAIVFMILAAVAQTKFGEKKFFSYIVTGVTGLIALYSLYVCVRAKFSGESSYVTQILSTKTSEEKSKSENKEEKSSKRDDDDDEDEEERRRRKKRKKEKEKEKEKKSKE